MGCWGMLQHAPTCPNIKNGGDMPKYNPEIHHRRSIRLKGYDYSQPGLYFITICVHNREHLFGEIVGGKMGMNDAGKIAEQEWLKTAEMRENVELLEYVIMPNHMHGIILLNDRRGTTRCRGTTHRAPTIEQFGKPTSNTIPTIVRGYKSAVTKKINMLRNMPGVPVWQRNYYEHIIRDQKSYYHIAKYIRNNPLKWRDDRFSSQRRRI